MKRNIYSFLIGLFVLSFAGFWQNTSAQTTNSATNSDSQIIFTWETGNFYPADFQGKPLPTPGSSVAISAEVIKSGKLSDITSSDITWYLDGDFMRKGSGEKKFSFMAKRNNSGKHTVRVKIQTSESSLDYSINIPVTDPLVVVETPYLGNVVPAGGQIILKAVPYFFNNSSINQLLFMWQIGNVVEKHLGDNVILLNIGTPQTSGQKIFITTSVQNQDNLLEYMNKNTILVVK
ncbi:MAG: hypothetical protein WC988_04620 [Patescibacteria group bacterium]